MSQKVDARGLTCPAPVLLVKDTIESDAPRGVTVLVDNQASSENVSRFLGSKGYKVNESKQGTDFVLEAVLEGNAPTQATTAEQKAPSTGDTAKILVLVTGDSIGSGDPSLGSKLMVSYLKTIKEMGDELWQLIFVNKGVTLTIDTSPVLAELKEYEDNGVIVLACGTCLEHFCLTDRKKVGGTTNMLDIVTATQLADKVITIG
ncbi:sulfurtransferase-like selenium metabolism protein YedF [Desulfopila sp. IMCC35008]|uniref:sulfurtransferase-like selenium metabolism protein YedF n=1 Tax=Desulfopila sp. IMCC35008 TaxID=2653858 RepID=UPI0013D277B5|nr:sulfurtransferase-like selenium metabolism protein YedF [Desulfopila sp. IMCC35008]